MKELSYRKYEWLAHGFMNINCWNMKPCLPMLPIFVFISQYLLCLLLVWCPSDTYSECQLRYKFLKSKMKFRESQCMWENSRIARSEISHYFKASIDFQTCISNSVSSQNSNSIQLLNRCFHNLCTVVKTRYWKHNFIPKDFEI